MFEWFNPKTEPKIKYVTKLLKKNLNIFVLNGKQA